MDIDFSKLVHEALDEIYLIDDRSGRFLFANPIALSNTGYTLAELQRMTPLDLQAGVGLRDLLERVAPLRSGLEAAVRFETEYQRKDGSRYRVDHRVQLVSGQDPPVFVVRAREVVEGAGSSPADERYRRMIEGTSDGAWAIDADGTTTYVNETMASKLGYTREEMIGRPLFDFMDDEGRAAAAVNLERRREGHSDTHDAKLIRKDGGELWVIVAAQPVYDAEGKYAGAVAMITDITRRKIQERALLDTLAIAPADDLQGSPAYLGGPLAISMPPISGYRADRVAKRFAILSDPRRLELIELLASHDELSVTQLAGLLHMSQSNVSKHLRLLSEADLVTRRHEANKTLYTLADPTVALLCRLVCHWLGTQAQAEFEALAG